MPRDRGAGPGRKPVAVLGATGSIGRQALEVLGEVADRFEPIGLSAGSDLPGLVAQVRNTSPRFVALERANDASQARSLLAAAAPGAEVRVGPGSAAWLAGQSGAAIVVNGIVGAAGLEASLATLASGARLALANKETLVVGGALVRAALERGGELIPVDSEHSAAFQCLAGRPAEEVRKLVITASGGALRVHPDWTRATPEEVLDHPVWSMGRRITVDSALLFNKGLELIEAEALFALGWDRLEAVLHPQAVVHALVVFRDGSTLVQAARPDMRIPIRLALSWPERWPDSGAATGALDLDRLEFRPLPRGRYPAFDLAVDAGRAGGTAPCVLNAADEIAVEAFLEGAIPLGQVPEIVRRTVERHAVEPVVSLEQLTAVDAAARAAARDLLVRA
jgi:1-deoxy-D-xylulose-5-phosphate reductoisomerase